MSFVISPIFGLVTVMILKYPNPDWMTGFRFGDYW